MPRDEQALRATVEQSAAVLTAAGFPRMPARVLMALLVAWHPLSLSSAARELSAAHRPHGGRPRREADGEHPESARPVGLAAGRNR